MMHSGHRERIRERFFKEGLSGFAPHEVLELLLCFAIPQKDVNPLAHALIDRFGSLSAVLEARAEELTKEPGIGRNAAALITLMPQLMSYYERDKQRDRPRLINFEEAGKYCRSLLRARKKECVYLLCLTAQGYLIQASLLHEGTIDESQVYPREVATEALMHSAYCVLLAHNHPGGDALPSAGDYKVTQTVIDTLKMLEIQVMDHIIVGENTYSSMSRMQMIDKGKLVAMDDFNYRVRMASMPAARRTELSQVGTVEDYDGFMETE